MDTLIIGNQTREQRRAAIIRVVKSGKPETGARIDFVNLDDAWKILSDKRRAILHVMAGVGPLTIREIARGLGRDVRAVHSDVLLLHRSGVIDKTGEGRMVLPYTTVKFDFTLGTRKVA